MQAAMRALPTIHNKGYKAAILWRLSDSVIGEDNLECGP